MGRSVSYPSNSIVAFTSFECDDEYDQSAEWDWFVECLGDRLGDMFPSATECSVWIGREDRAIAENSFAHFGVSEYCGLVAVWISPKDAYDGYENRDTAGLQANWLGQVGNKFVEEFSTLNKMGTMSNGVSVFKAVA